MTMTSLIQDFARNLLGLDVINKAWTRRQLHPQFFISCSDTDSAAATSLADRNDGRGVDVLVVE